MEREVIAVPDKDRVIYLIDMDAYFASIEELYHPELKKIPMAVCGDPASRRGIILAKNQLAKGYGVKTTDTIWSARQKCPDLVLRPPRRHDYEKYCEIANAIYGQYTDLVEKGGLDESFMDVTGSLHLFGGDSVKLAHEIRERVHRETGLTVSIGISLTKYLPSSLPRLTSPTR